MTPRVEIYTWSTCPFCLTALALLDRKGIAYQRLSIDGDEAAREEMARRAGGKRTLPQIFLDGRSIGGCTDLQALEASGELDRLLAGVS